MKGLMLKLKLQYFGHLMETADYWKRPWCWEWLKAKREEGGRGWDWLDSITNSADMNLGKPQEMVRNREAWHTAVRGVIKVGHNGATKQQ